MDSYLFFFTRKKKQTNNFAANFETFFNEFKQTKKIKFFFLKKKKEPKKFSLLVVCFNYRIKTNAVLK